MCVFFLERGRPGHGISPEKSRTWDFPKTRSQRALPGHPGPGTSGLGSVSRMAHWTPSLSDSQRPVTVRGTSRGIMWVSSREILGHMCSPQHPLLCHAQPATDYWGRERQKQSDLSAQVGPGGPTFPSVSVSRGGTGLPRPCPPPGHSSAAESRALTQPLH